MSRIGISRHRTHTPGCQEMGEAKMGGNCSVSMGFPSGVMKMLWNWIDLVVL